jgi:hypothetical protein
MNLRRDLFGLIQRSIFTRVGTSSIPGLITIGQDECRPLRRCIPGFAGATLATATR